MEIDQALAFAVTRNQGVLATVRRDGRPQLSNIIYHLADGVIRISVTEDRAKTRNLRRDPRGTLYVAGDDFWHWVVLDGRAELSPVAGTPDDATVTELVDLYRAIRGEHPDWNEYRQVMVDERRLVVRLSVDHAYGMLP
jgi:PPOX class probable F420-dependent enzyme